MNYRKHYALKKSEEIITYTLNVNFNDLDLPSKLTSGNTMH